ncbi:ATP-binding protein [Haliangium sp.]|uniref:ATP-binding protein n=1 Tax=Haliangium sp. TaxID=2663208 RepID=UPI003D103B97
MDDSSPHAPASQAWSEHSLGPLLAHLADGVLVVADDGRVRFANPAAAALLGRPAHDLIGARCPLPLTDDGPVSLPDQPERLVSVRVSHATHAGQQVAIATLHEVTDQLRAERRRHRVMLAARRAAMVQVARTAAHEIRNPAAVILANLSMMGKVVEDLDTALTEGGLSRRKRTQLRIDEALTDMREMLADNIASIARMRSFLQEFRDQLRTPRPPVEWIDLSEVAAVACDLCTPLAAPEVHITHDLPALPRIAGDWQGLVQVAASLVTNAVEAALAHHRASDSATPGRVEVRTYADDTHVFLMVSDTGAGIDPAAASALFDPLFVPSVGGKPLGMSLAIVADIVSEHGGQVETETAPDAGSRFQISLPRDNGLTPTEPTETAAPGALRGRVLIIVDDPDMTRSLRRLLQEEHDLVCADGGAQAFDIVMIDRDFDVILCALSMREMDGAEVYRRVRALSADLAARMVFIGDSTAAPSVEQFVATERPMVLELPLAPELLRDLIARRSR